MNLTYIFLFKFLQKILDSNQWNILLLGGFQDRWIKPLSQSSKIWLNNLCDTNNTHHGGIRTKPGPYMSSFLIVSPHKPHCVVSNTFLQCHNTTTLCTCSITKPLFLFQRTMFMFYFSIIFCFIRADQGSINNLLSVSFYFFFAIPFLIHLYIYQNYKFLFHNFYFL